MRVNQNGKARRKIHKISSSFNSEEDIKPFNEMVEKHRLAGLAALVEKRSKREEHEFSTLW